MLALLMFILGFVSHHFDSYNIHLCTVTVSDLGTLNKITKTCKIYFRGFPLIVRRMSGNLDHIVRGIICHNYHHPYVYGRLCSLALNAVHSRA